MSDPKKAVYEADPHTRAKHAILREYLKRWMIILARSSDRLLYVDGFAGAGVYEKDVPGSPQVPVDVVLSLQTDLQAEVEIVCIENRKDRVEHLRDVMKSRRAEAQMRRVKIREPIESECVPAVEQLLQSYQLSSKPLGPAFFFLDQFGYADFPVSLVRRILEHDRCEVFSYLNWNFLGTFFDDKSKFQTYDRVFENDGWRKLIGLSPRKKKEEAFREYYRDTLRVQGKAKYVYPFEMRDKNDNLIYWLFFSTNSLKGLIEMKKAMWCIDSSGGFQFSDKHATSGFGKLFAYDSAALFRDLVQDLAGQELTVAELEEYVLVNTPAYKCYDTFGDMEAAGNLKVLSPPASRKLRSFGSFPEMRVRVQKTESQTELFGS